MLGSAGWQLIPIALAALQHLPCVTSTTEDGAYRQLRGNGDGVGGSENATGGNRSSYDEACQHGDWNATRKQCECHEGWATAGITDTIDFLHGVCAQYHCQSSEECQAALGLPHAICPVPNWNCYCGWFWVGHQTEASGNHTGAKCMGVMYTFSVWATELLEWLMAHTWKLYVPMVILLLPFGRKRANCDHHRPSMWNSLRRCCGCQSSCHGECVLTDRYTFDVFKDDMAWSLYVADLCLWTYLFMLCVYAIVLVIWSILLWLAVMLALLCSMLFGACAVCSEGGGGGADCDCCVCAAGNESCDCCGMCMFAGGHHSFQPIAYDTFYWGGVYPQDTFWGYGYYGHLDFGGHYGQTGRCSCCLPVAWLFYVFPVLPENAWGGFCGYVFFGTHQHTPPERLYQGNNPVIEFLRMGWRRQADLHDNQSWRLQVYNFLADEGEVFQDPLDNRVAGWTGATWSPLARSSDEQPYSMLHEGILRRVIPVGRAHAVCIERPFDEEDDQCIKSSFDDYQRNACWICMSEGEEWDLWLSCHHLFCKACSTEMLRRRMPCPLCRVASSTVLRGARCRRLEDSSEDPRPADVGPPALVDPVAPVAPGTPGTPVPPETPEPPAPVFPRAPGEPPVWQEQAGPPEEPPSPVLNRSDVPSPQAVLGVGPVLLPPGDGAEQADVVAPVPPERQAPEEPANRVLDLRLRLRHALVRKQREGVLRAALALASQPQAGPDARDRLRLRGALLVALESGALELLLQEHTRSLPLGKASLVQCRERLRSILGDACRDGRLHQALLGARRVEGGLGLADLKPAEGDLDLLRQRMRELLLEANRAGSLREALGSAPVRKCMVSTHPRERLRDLLVESHRNGRLQMTLGEVRRANLKRQLRSALVEACRRGALESAMQAALPPAEAGAG